MNIPYPSDSEILRQTEIICSTALPQKITFCSFLRDMIHSLKIQQIFWGIYDVLFLALGIFLVLAAAGFQLITNIQLSPYASAFVFSFSPALLLMMLLFSSWKEHNYGIYEIKMTCRYTVHHLLAYRMLVCSAIGLGLTTVYLILINYYLQLSVVRLLSFAYCSVFIFSILQIQVILSSEAVISSILLSFGWMLFHGVLGYFLPGIYARLLIRLPLLIWLLCDGFLLCILGYKLNTYVKRICYACY